MYTHAEETLMAQRQITSAFKLGRECYLNNSFRGPVPPEEQVGGQVGVGESENGCVCVWGTPNQQ